MHSVVEFYLFQFPTLKLPLYMINYVNLHLLCFWVSGVSQKSLVYYMVLGQNLGLHKYSDCFHKNIRS